MIRNFNQMILRNYCSCMTFEAALNRLSRSRLHSFPHEFCHDESCSYITFDSWTILDRVTKHVLRRRRREGPWPRLTSDHSALANCLTALFICTADTFYCL